jgi:hypothetical protein
MTKDNQPPFDPKLKEAIAEMEAIAKKHGIAALFCLASETHGEFKAFFPSWSIIQLREKEGEQRFRVQVKKDQHDLEQVNASLHLAYSLRDMAGVQYQNFETICTVLTEKLNVEHVPFHGNQDFDGWQQPDLGPAPARIIDFNEQRGKGFGSGK